MNKHVVEQYMRNYSAIDRPAVLALLTDDVEWICPGSFHLKGKAAFDKEMKDHEHDGNPQITVTRMTEENNVVIAEGKVHIVGNPTVIVFCDVFEFEKGKIKKLISYLAPA